VTDARRYIVIEKWDGPHGFQHYKDRSPLWIKNYTELMSKDDYLGLTFHQRGVLHGLWLEYARARRQLPDSTVALTRRLGQRVTRATLDALNHAGFITYSASKPLAPRYQAASPEVEVEKKPPTPFFKKGKNDSEGGTMIDLPDAWQKFIAGHGWDELFTPEMILEELARLSRGRQTTGVLDEREALEAWRQERARRFPEVAA
jgi:hypothetical protein